MLRLPPFQLHNPTNLDDAAKMLADHGGKARLLAGGTDLLPNMKRRHQSAAALIGLRRVEGLRGIRDSGSGETAIGAMTTLTDIVRSELIHAKYPMLWRAVASISSPVLQSTGTIGGNLCLDTRCTYYNQNEEWRESISFCMKEEGQTCWVAPNSPRCWAISASDSAPVLSAIEAKVKLVSAGDGERIIAVRDLFNDDGIDYLKKRPDEVLTEVILPDPSAFKASHWKLRRRGSIDYSVLTVGAAAWFDGDKVQKLNIHLGAVNSYPAVPEKTCEFLIGKILDEETIAEAAGMSRQGSTPMDNTDFLARWRGQMVERYVSAALREIAGLDPGVKKPRHAM